MGKTISKTCLDLVKEFEGCYLKAYQDEVKVWTIGYGITNSDKAITGTTIKAGLTITKATAEEWLEKSLIKKYLPNVLKYDSKYNWNQNEIDALVSFCYNIGSIDGLCNNGQRTREQIAKKMLEYNKAGGKVYNGLTRRRTAERDLFVMPTKVLPKLPVDGKTTHWRIGDGKDTRTTTYDVKQIKAIQTAMNELGIKDEDGKKLGLNGYYGVKTASSVANFQKKYGLTPNGKFGNRCLEVLKELGYK